MSATHARRQKDNKAESRPDDHRMAVTDKDDKNE